MKTSVTKAVALAATLMLAPALANAQEVSAELIAKAKQEGKVVYYTDLIVDQIVRPLVAGFEAKYGVKVEYARSDSQANLLKLMGEQKAGSMQADVFAMTSGLMPLLEANAVMKLDLEGAKALPPEFKDPNGYWVAANYYVMTPAVNSDLVPEKDRPKTYDDLLDKKWTDKIVWKPNDTSGGPGFIGHVLRVMGEDKGMDYLRKLKAQRIKSVSASARAVLDQVIAGEYPIVLQIFNHHAALSAKKGAPSQWLKLEPVMVQTELHAITAAAPHPNAAKLFVEYMISKEGQMIFQKADYFPTRSDVPASMPELAPSTGGFKAVVMSPDDIARDYEKWAAIYMDMFR
jgi:ABC-type Fe3+ transport system substrate-binding protein